MFANRPLWLHSHSAVHISLSDSTRVKFASLGGPSQRMSKRSLSTFVDSDSESSYEAEVVDSYSDDASKKKISSKSRRKKKIQKVHGSSSSVTHETNIDSPPHSKSSHIIESSGPIRLALLEWYKTVHDIRGMPWRKSYDPTLGPDERAQRAYEVWISEIMLQQTQVATVIPYYTRWMGKFPTIQRLAEASIDEVNALWKGLGYYSRASRLLAGAQKAVAEYGGKLPGNAKDMQANIPGIGRYSAGAICSIAYNEQVPVLDGNVHRLLSRLLALYSPPKAKSTQDILWAAATAMVEIGSSPNIHNHQYAGDVNQALIELGSTVCKVREPCCESCPLRTWCSAYRNCVEKNNDESIAIVDIEDICQTCEPLTSFEGVTSYPMKPNRKKAREELDIVSVIEWQSSPRPEDRLFLLTKRPEGGLLAGLYEFPTSDNVSKSIKPVAQEKLGRDILARLVQCTSEQTVSKIIPIGDVVHVFSHIRKTYRVQWVIVKGGLAPPKVLSHEMAHEFEQRIGKKSARGSRKAPTRCSQNGLWIPLNEVAETNMGTGVVKVWNLTKERWNSIGA